MSRAFAYSIIEDLIKSEEANISKSTLIASKVTKAARHYVYNSELPSTQLNGFHTEERVELTVLGKNSNTETVWYIEKIADRFNNIGYRIESWRDCLDVQVTQETANLAYLMIVTKATEVKDSQLIISRTI